MNNISVIIPVYNAENHLRKCIDSVLHQTVSVYEIILIDDGSTDLSGTICDTYGEQHNHIKVIHQLNKGVSAARNVGLSHATGDFISFVDADDRLEPDMYELLLDLIDTYGADIAHCGYKRMSEAETVIKECFGTHTIVEQNSSQAIDYMLRGVLFNNGLWNKLYQKNTIQGFHFSVDLKNNEDILFNFWAFQKANKLVFADETKYLYYEHATSVCNTLDIIRQLRDSIEASKRMIETNRIPELLPLLNRRYYETNMQLYRYFLLHNPQNDDLLCQKQETQRAYRLPFRKNAKTIMNRFFIMKLPTLYKAIYKLYDKHRSPKWDVESDQS